MLAEGFICLPIKPLDNYSFYPDKNKYRIVFTKPLNFISFVNGSGSQKITGFEDKIVKQLKIPVKDQYKDEKWLQTGFILDNFYYEDMELYSFV